MAAESKNDSNNNAAAMVASSSSDNGLTLLPSEVANDEEHKKITAFIRLISYAVRSVEKVGDDCFKVNFYYNIEVKDLLKSCGLGHLPISRPLFKRTKRYIEITPKTGETNAPKSLFHYLCLLQHMQTNETEKAPHKLSVTDDLPLAQILLQLPSEHHLELFIQLPSSVLADEFFGRLGQDVLILARHSRAHAMAQLFNKVSKNTLASWFSDDVFTMFLHDAACHQSSEGFMQLLYLLENQSNFASAILGNTGEYSMTALMPAAKYQSAKAFNLLVKFALDGNDIEAFLAILSRQYRNHNKINTCWSYITQYQTADGLTTFFTLLEQHVKQLNMDLFDLVCETFLMDNTLVHFYEQRAVKIIRAVVNQSTDNSEIPDLQTVDETAQKHVIATSSSSSSEASSSTLKYLFPSQAHPELSVAAASSSATIPPDSDALKKETITAKEEQLLASRTSGTANAKNVSHASFFPVADPSSNAPLNLESPRHQSHI